MKRLIVALLLASVCSLPAFAAPITYQIEFTGASIMNAPLPSGSFVFDPSSGFSNFFVIWNGATFDLTSAANAPALATDPPTGCNSATSNYQYGFTLMGQTAAGCTAPAQYAWSGLYFGGTGAEFDIILNVTNGPLVAQDLIGALELPVPESPLMDMGSGGWTVSPVNSVPEPPSLAMGLALALSLAGMTLAGKSRQVR